MPRRTPWKMAGSPPVRERGRRQGGIALLVVMVVFVILYLVVYQLHFSTSMEERIAQVRYGEVETAISLHSVALYVVTLLVEDLKEDAGAASGASAAAPLEGPGRDPRGGARPGPEGSDTGEGFTPLVPETGGAKGFDYLHENLFNDNRQQVADTTVKIRVVDGERRFDLNRLFDYVRLEDEDVVTGVEDLREDELLGAVEGKSDEDAAKSLRDKIMSKSREGRAGSAKKKSAAEGAEPGKASAKDGPDEGAAQAAGTLDEYEEEEEWVPPDEVRIQATTQLVERAISYMFSVNENEYGYRYGPKYSSSELATSIVQYVLERRRAPYQNRIYMTSELLNIPGITPLVYYGPMPLLKEGDEIPVGDGFVLRRDDFGEVVPEYLYNEDAEFQEEERLQLEELQKEWGRFADLPGFGLDPLKANAMTRGMSEQPIALDDAGNEYVVERPIPIGLKDIFTTASSGKININTAPTPVIYGLLRSLSEEEANIVTLDIRDYRNRFQEEEAEEGVGRVDDKNSPDMGQPKRKAKKDDPLSKTGASASGASALGGLADLDPAALDELSAYQDVETNYFTSLQQLELIDGTEGDARDRMRKDEGVERVSAEEDTLFRRVIHDLEKVAVFGSTYFEAELKAKPKKGGSVKTGYLTLRRDTEKKVCEVLMWKHLQK